MVVSYSPSYQMPSRSSGASIVRDIMAPSVFLVDPFVHKSQNLKIKIVVGVVSVVELDSIGVTTIATYPIVPVVVR